MYQEIFKQGKIGNITLKNRLVMSPMGTSLAEMDGSPSEDMIAFYKARAIGGAALIIPEIARVNDLHGAGMMRQLSVSKDRHIEGLAKLAETVHKYGTKIFIQLHHPGRETVTALTGGSICFSNTVQISSAGNKGSFNRRSKSFDPTVYLRCCTSKKSGLRWSRASCGSWVSITTVSFPLHK